jgi:hypothetical protein
VSRPRCSSSARCLVWDVRVRGPRAGGALRGSALRCVTNTSNVAKGRAAATKCARPKTKSNTCYVWPGGKIELVKHVAMPMWQ